MFCCGLIELYEMRGMYLTGRLPCVVTFGVALPFDKVL